MSEETIYTFENEAYRKTYWHTCSHVMAQAVKRLYPEAKLAIGPPSTMDFTTTLTATWSLRQRSWRRSNSRCGRSARRS